MLLSFSELKTLEDDSLSHCGERDKLLLAKGTIFIDLDFRGCSMLHNYLSLINLLSESEAWRELGASLTNATCLASFGR